MFLHHSPAEMKEEEFRNPPAKFRGAPFWAWNCKLEKEMLRKQIGYFQEMGMGGFHMHCRTGMDTEYLGDEFMDMVADCNETAKKKEMLCWLYDEDRYASGYGGGYVTKDICYRERYLLFTPYKKSDVLPGREAFQQACEEGKEPAGYFLKAYRVFLKDGRLERYEVLEEAPEEDGIWYAYLMIDEKSSWWNNQTYVNTLDKKAIDRFIQITHEKYYEKLGKDFGKSIPAIFTDEPQFIEIENLNFAEEKKELKFPFTDDMDESFRSVYGESLTEHFPEIVWEQKNDQPATMRYRYINHLTDRFVESYAKNISTWCEAHNLAMTGHMKGEETLHSQTVFTGETMRSLRYFHIPGHDVLCDQRDYPTAKMAQSVARQYGRYGALTETYGVTNWDFDFKGHKMSGDWQATMGINVRVHHVSWLSMKGEAKRDYPASINYQSPWYRKYDMIENYFGRINAAMTSGTPQVRIGVIHPVESYWMVMGPNDQTSEKQSSLEEQYRNLCDWLTFYQLDFDYISEALLEEQDTVCDEQGFAMGQMRYSVVLVPGCITLRKNTVERLKQFAGQGGSVLILGDAPQYIDGMQTEKTEELTAVCESVAFEKKALMKVLEPYRSLEVLLDDGTRADNLLYQMRKDREGQWLFLAHGYEKIRDTFWNMLDCKDYPYIENLHLRIGGTWQVIRYDAMTGEKEKVPCSYRKNQTWIEYPAGVHDSLLLRLLPLEGKTEQTETHKCVQTEIGERIHIEEPWKVTREEPNVFLMDRAAYRIDQEAWKEEEDILKLDNLCRRRFGYPLKEEAGAQPWTVQAEEACDHVLSLRFEIVSEIDTDVTLALESREETRIFVNGKEETGKSTGWYVDESIETVPVSSLHKGTNTIELQIPYGEKANVESCYLLGEFGVEVAGKYKKITAPKDQIVFGDLTHQGLPFYGGNLTYHCHLHATGKPMRLRAQYFSSPVLEVRIDGKEAGNIAFAPYEIDLSNLTEGDHELELVAYGNRFATFGQLHNCDKNYSWFASCSWRTKGDRYAEEYQMKDLGILVTPELLTE